MIPQDDQPLRLLHDQELPTSPFFFERLRNKIEGRTATSQVVSYSWNIPKVILLEMIGLVTHIFSVLGTPKERRR